MSTLEFRKTSASDPLADSLISELSQDLKGKTGRDGRESFKDSDVELPRSTFLLAIKDDQAVGCGAVKPLGQEVCEIKRMYSRNQRKGVGTRILKELEKQAMVFGYKQAWLETGIENHGAIRFYVQNGYRIRENYGKYIGRPECVCFEKSLVE